MMPQRPVSMRLTFEEVQMQLVDHLLQGETLLGPDAQKGIDPRTDTRLRT
jgi:hypothetical protein